MERIKLGIVGLGAMGQRMLSLLSKNSYENIELIAVCDSNESLLKQVSEQYQIKNYTNNYKELLQNEDINLIFIAVPPKFHKQVVLDSIKKNKHVLCEKPLASSLEDAFEMLEAVNNNQVHHMMNFPLNYQGAIHKMMNLIQDGYVGEIKGIDLTLQFPEWPRPWQKNNWISSKEQGGFILEVGAHWIQLIQKNFGEIHHIQGEVLYPSDPFACENHVEVKMTLDTNVQVNVNGSSQIPKNERVEMVVHGSNGILMIENWSTLKGGRSGESIVEISTQDTQVRSLLENLQDLFVNNRATIFDFFVGYNVQVVLEAFRNENLKNGIHLKNMYKYPNGQ